MLVYVGKYSKKTSISSQRDTSVGATNGVCALGVESSPNMVTVSPSPWKGMFSMSCALGAYEDEGIDIDEAFAASLEDESFLLVLCLFDEDSTSMASFNHLCCRSRNLIGRLATIFF